RREGRRLADQPERRAAARVEARRQVRARERRRQLEGARRRVRGMGSRRHGVLARREEPSGRDRKSTRLNSSHRTISYDVFCLKKKNEPHGETIKHIGNPKLLLTTYFALSLLDIRQAAPVATAQVPHNWTQLINHIQLHIHLAI